MPGPRIGLQTRLASASARAPSAFLPRWGFSSHLEATVGGLTGSAQAAKLRSAGATILRNDISWSATETSKGVFNWTQADLVMGACQANGLKLVVQAGYAPAWANGSGDNKIRPTTAQDFGDWIRALVARAHTNYPGTVVAIEYWNEPNIAFLKNSDGTQATATVYTAMARAAYITKTTNDPAPEIELWAGATSGLGEYAGAVEANAWNWLTEALGAGILGCCDAWSCHPYQFFTDATVAQLTDTATGAWGSNWSRLFWASTEPPNLATRLANAGYTGRIHGTEWGAPTYAFPSGTHITDCTSEANQASMFSTSWPNWKAQSRAGHLFFYTGIDDSSTDTTSRENHFGAFRSDLSAKAVVANMQAV